MFKSCAPFFASSQGMIFKNTVCALILILSFLYIASANFSRSNILLLPKTLYLIKYVVGS